MANLPIREHDLIRFVTELMVGEMRRLTQGLTLMSEGKEREGKQIEWPNIWFAFDPSVKPDGAGYNEMNHSLAWRYSNKT